MLGFRMGHLSIAADAAKLCSLLIERWFGGRNEDPFNLVQGAPYRTGEPLCFVIPRREVPTLIHTEQAKPTEILPSMGEAVTPVRPQSLKQSCVALTCLPDIDRATRFVIQDINTDLLSKIDDSVAATTLQNASPVALAPEDCIATPHQSVILDD